MSHDKLREVVLDVKIGSFVTIAPIFEFPVGTDLTGWTAQFVLALDQGPVIFDTTTPLTVDLLNPSHGRVSPRLTDVITRQLRIGRKQHYHFRVIDAAGTADVLLHGPVDAYVVSGAR
jgi:hypothetical protein